MVTKHTIKSARYMWNYVVELTFDDNRVAAFDFEPVVKLSDTPTVAQYANSMRLFRKFSVENPNQLAWFSDMVFDANWLYALMPDLEMVRYMPQPITLSVNCKL